MKGYLVIQLFDEYVDDVLEDDRNRLTDIYQRISSRFIGDLRIPLTDLYFSQRVRGINLREFELEKDQTDYQYYSRSKEPLQCTLHLFWATQRRC